MTLEPLTMLLGVAGTIISALITALCVTTQKRIVEAHEQARRNAEDIAATKATVEAMAHNIDYVRRRLDESR